MFIDEECGNLQVVVDGREFTKNNNRMKKSDVLQGYRCQICKKCYRRAWGKHGFSCGYFFCREVVNKLKGRELFSERMIKITLVDTTGIVGSCRI